MCHPDICHIIARAFGWVHGRCGLCLMPTTRKNFARHVRLAHRGHDAEHVPYRDVIEVPLFKLTLTVLVAFIMASCVVGNLLVASIYVLDHVNMLYQMLPFDLDLAYVGPRPWEVLRGAAVPYTM